MSISESFTFTNSLNFNLSDTQISGGVAKRSLIPNTGQVFSQAFDNDTDFTYDSAKAEFTAGLVRQKDLTPSNSIMAGKMVTKDLNWHKEAAVTGTLNGVPTFGTGKMVCTGSQGLYYDGVTNTIETIKFKYTPNYSGNPPGNINMVSIYNGTNANDRFTLTHSPSGDNFRIGLFSATGGVLYSIVTIGANNQALVAGTEYEFEVIIDSVNGVVRLFKNGVSVGTLNPGVFTRGTVASRYYVGAVPAVYNQAEASFDDFIVFEGAQHTAGYTPGYTLVDTIYAESEVELPSFAYTGIGTIQAVESSSFVESGSPRYTVGGFYWNGSAWVSSNGSYAQANSSATLIANLTSLTVTGASTIAASVIFPDSNTLSSVDSIMVTVTGQKYSLTGYLEPVQAIQVSALDSYEESVVIPSGSTYGIILKIDGSLKYFVGTVLTASDGTIAQSNTAAQLSAALPYSDFGSNSSVYLRWVFGGASQQVTAEIDSATISYDFGGVVEPADKCLVYGYVKDIADRPVKNAHVIFELYRSDSNQYREASSSTILKSKVTVTTNALGYYEANLIRSSEYDEEGTYQVTFKNDIYQQTAIASAPLTFTVPDADTKALADLINL